jgi:hypothetical protein
METKQNRSLNGGFTLIELPDVVGIIAILRRLRVQRMLWIGLLQNQSFLN